MRWRRTRRPARSFSASRSRGNPSDPAHLWQYGSPYAGDPLPRMSEPSAFFEQDGSRFIPSVLTRGPWRPEHQHGGPPAALMARAIEAEADALHLARFTVDFVQPVPIAPLTLRVEQVREGRRARNYVVELSGADDLVVARSTALVLRPAPAASDVAITRQRLDPPPPQPPPSLFPSSPPPL